MINKITITKKIDFSNRCTKTILKKQQKRSERKIKPLNEITFKNIIETNLELKNGTKTKILVIFNNTEINFEEINIGLNKAFKLAENIKSSQTTFNVFVGKILKPTAVFKEKYF